LILDLEEANRDRENGYTGEKIVQLLWSCQSIAGLDPGNGHTIQSHVVWVLTALNSLGSPLCFGAGEGLEEYDA
jgi:hypothetical protein